MSQMKVTLSKMFEYARLSPASRSTLVHTHVLPSCARAAGKVSANRAKSTQLAGGEGPEDSTPVPA